MRLSRRDRWGSKAPRCPDRTPLSRPGRAPPVRGRRGSGQAVRLAGAGHNASRVPGTHPPTSPRPGHGRPAARPWYPPADRPAPAAVVPAPTPAGGGAGPRAGSRRPVTLGFLFVHHLPSHRVERHELRVDLPRGWLPDDPWAIWYGPREITPTAEGVQLLPSWGVRVEARWPLPPVIRLPTPAPVGQGIGVSGCGVGG